MYIVNTIQNICQVNKTMTSTNTQSEYNLFMVSESGGAGIASELS